MLKYSTEPKPSIFLVGYSTQYEASRLDRSSNPLKCLRRHQARLKNSTLLDPLNKYFRPRFPPRNPSLLSLIRCNFLFCSGVGTRSGQQGHDLPGARVGEGWRVVRPHQGALACDNLSHGSTFGPPLTDYNITIIVQRLKRAPPPPPHPPLHTLIQ